MLFANLVQANLKTKNLGQQIEYYTRLRSTNKEAWNLSNNGAQSGAIVITDNQYEGKGRNNRHWLSISNKSLTFSILINKIIPAELIAWIPLIVNISIEKALSNFNINITLKWPNDLILDNKKLGGILCESKIIGSSLKKIVIGIGLNINETIDELNQTIQNTATSLYSNSGKLYQREKILAEILNQMEPIIDGFPKNMNLVRNNWESACYHMNKKIEFHHGSKKVKGEFIGLGETGSAILDIKGSKSEIINQEIK